MDTTMLTITCISILFLGYFGTIAVDANRLTEVCLSNNMIKDEFFDNTLFGWNGVICKYLDEGVWKYVRFDKNGKRIPEGE